MTKARKSFSSLHHQSHHLLPNLPYGKSLGVRENKTFFPQVKVWRADSRRKDLLADFKSKDSLAIQSLSQAATGNYTE